MSTFFEDLNVLNSRSLLKDKTDIFKKQYIKGVLNEIFFKNVLKTNEIARP